MTTATTASPLVLVPSLETTWEDVDSSFERFCLTAGIGAMEQMLCEDAPAAHRGAQHPQRARQPRFHGGTEVGVAERHPHRLAAPADVDQAIP